MRDDRGESESLMQASMNRVSSRTELVFVNVLTIRYDRILLPHLKTAKLYRGLKAKVSRNMLSQRHGLFLQRLAGNAQSGGLPRKRIPSAARRKNATVGGCSSTLGVPKHLCVVVDT